MASIYDIPFPTVCIPAEKFAELEAKARAFDELVDDCPGAGVDRPTGLMLATELNALRQQNAKLEAKERIADEIRRHLALLDEGEISFIDFYAIIKDLYDKEYE